MKKYCTIFCDIDGTLFEYRKFETYMNTKPEIITSTVNSINKAFNEGHHIVMTTARPEYLREHTIKELKEAHINYHKLVMEIGRGTRILINDKENPLVDRAYGINVVRNKGFDDKQQKLFNNILS